MSGEEVRQKLKVAGYGINKVAELMNVIPQSVNQSLNAQDVKSGFLEGLCRALNVKLDFFYGDSGLMPLTALSDENGKKLAAENKTLKEELEKLKKLKLSSKDGKVYDLWMKFMDVTSEMQKLYKDEKY